MGNSASSGRGHHEDTVDFGYLAPQGIYTGPRDWNHTVVTQLIVERKLAPFYRPLEDYDESWDDEQILAARKDPPEAEAAEPSRVESATSSLSKGHAKRPSAVKDSGRNPEAAIYRGATECPICFLYYPPNINRSRCCDQAICTECFVQIKRADPTTTHLVSEPAACPYCVQENFGVVYTPPPWRAGLGSEGATPPSWPDSAKTSSDAKPLMKRRRKSFGHNDPEVVAVDHIHPDWEAKLAAVRAAVQRRANRRIIMRQVGDRLIPVGVTSGRVHAIPAEEAGSEAPDSNGDRGSRRGRRRQQNQELSQFLGSMGLGGQDLEELMVMEAMRLSLLEHEEQQRRQQQEETKKKAQAAAEAGEGNLGATSESQAASSESTSNSSDPATHPVQDAASTPPSRTSLSGPTPPTTNNGLIREPSDQLAPVSASTSEGTSGPQTPPPPILGDTVPIIFEPTESQALRPFLADPPSSSPSSASHDISPSEPSVSNKPLLASAANPTTSAAS